MFLHSRILSSLRSQCRCYTPRHTPRPTDLSAYLVRSADKDPTTNVQRGTRFEFCTQTALLQHFGMQLKHYGGRGDGGIDLRGVWPLSTLINSSLPSNITLFVQCKDHQKGVSPEHVRSLIGAIVSQQDPSQLSIGILASPYTQKGFTSQVIKAFEATRIPLGLAIIDGLDVTELVFNENAKDAMPGLDVTRRFLPNNNTSEPVLTFNGRPVSINILAFLSHCLTHISFNITTILYCSNVPSTIEKIHIAVVELPDFRNGLRHVQRSFSVFKEAATPSNPAIPSSRYYLDKSPL
ncbi:hypothetical protein BGW37DRAFT_518792 [Umbelopsis sp. PMI_123]|nr:hypothetical protein BGW37DRAFT_518792 [Umbelopsis sp. PMI_123]